MNELMNNACWLMTAEAMWEHSMSETGATDSETYQTEDDTPLFI